jgi:hypothetical protein
MNNPQFTPELQDKIDKLEFYLADVKDQDLLYSSFRDFIRDMPNNYELGTVIRRLFSTN